MLTLREAFTEQRLQDQQGVPNPGGRVRGGKRCFSGKTRLCSKGWAWWGGCGRSTWVRGAVVTYRYHVLHYLGTLRLRESTDDVKASQGHRAHFTGGQGWVSVKRALGVQSRKWPQGYWLALTSISAGAFHTLRWLNERLIRCWV